MQTIPLKTQYVLPQGGERREFDYGLQLGSIGGMVGEAVRRPWGRTVVSIPQQSAVARPAFSLAEHVLRAWPAWLGCGSGLGLGSGAGKGAAATN